MEVNTKNCLTELKAAACEARKMGGGWEQETTIFHKKVYGIILLLNVIKFTKFITKSEKRQDEEPSFPTPKMDTNLPKEKQNLKLPL